MKTISNEHERTLTSVTGTHLPSMTLEDVTFLSISQLKSTQFVSGIDKFFENLRGFDVIDSDLAEISAEDLEPFPKLVVLNLNINKLTSLDGDLFKFHPGIQWIGFMSNALKNVGSDLLSGLNSLTSANFQSNPCVNFWATSHLQVETLKQHLANGCPPLLTSTTAPTSSTVSTTTTTQAGDGECSAACKDLLEQEIIELRTSNERRFEEIEKTLREISSNPCSA